MRDAFILGGDAVSHDQLLLPARRFEQSRHRGIVIAGIARDIIPANVIAPFLFFQQSEMRNVL
jgi:hypothetical protein